MCGSLGEGSTGSVLWEDSLATQPCQPSHRPPQQATCVRDPVLCLTVRHILKFYHSTLTGKRIMWLDEREVYRVNTKYRLSGAVKVSCGWLLPSQCCAAVTQPTVHNFQFKLSKAVCVLNIDSHNAGSLSYTLVVNGKTVKENSCNDAIMRLAAWEVKLPHGLYDVEFGTSCMERGRGSRDE